MSSSDSEADEKDHKSGRTKSAFDTTVRQVLTKRDDIEKLFKELQGNSQFDLLPKDTSTDPHDEDDYHFSSFRTKSGGRLTQDILDNDFILVGNDKCGLSGVLDIPIPPGATLRVEMSTWLNPCHSDYGVEKCYSFGVGVFPYGESKEQRWLRSGTKSVIENGVQYFAEFDLMKFMAASRSFGGGGFGGLGGSRDGIDYSLTVNQGGQKQSGSSSSKMTLDTVDVRIRRNADGNTEFSFVHGSESHKIQCPVDLEQTTNKDCELFFNCLGWADNNTYVQIHKIEYDPPVVTGSDSDNNDDSNPKKKQRIEEETTEKKKPAKETE